jgi:hypothetical protein
MRMGMRFSSLMKIDLFTPVKEHRSCKSMLLSIDYHKKNQVLGSFTMVCDLCTSFKCFASDAGQNSTSRQSNFCPDCVRTVLRWISELRSIR